MRLNAAQRAMGEPEDALFWAKHEAKEARFDLDQYEKECRRREDSAIRSGLLQAAHDRKVRQIEASIAANNALCNPGDPEYWDPGAGEAAILYDRWRTVPEDEV